MEIDEDTQRTIKKESEADEQRQRRPKKRSNKNKHGDRHDEPLNRDIDNCPF